MSDKIQKRFGIWLDTHHATIIGYDPTAALFTVLGHAKNPGITLIHKFFKEISHHLVNADEIHITGSGTIQEQFMHYLGETPQFKKAVVTQSTSNPMSDDKLVEFITCHFKN